MVENLYATAFIASFIMVILLTIIGHKQNITYYLLMFVAIMISNMGYYVVASAQTLETAIMGHRMTYLGAVGNLILMLFCVMQLCRLAIPKILGIGLGGFGIVILYHASCVEYRTDFYRSIRLASDGGVSYLVKEYGPKHSLYMILLIGCVLATICVSLYSFFRQKRVSYKTTLCLLVAELLTVACYVTTKITNTNIEWIAVMYVLDEIMILILIRRIRMYEVSESVANSLNEHSTYGFIVFDKNRKYVGCNDIAKKYLPELDELKIDMEITEKTPFLYDNIQKWIDRCAFQHESNCMIEKDELQLKCSLKDLHYGRRKKRIGYLVELMDDTQQQKYIMLLNRYNADLENEVRDKTRHIDVMQSKMILGMADMIENRDSNTGGHIKRTSEVIRIFTKELQNVEVEYGFSKEFLEYVAKAAPMHDLGKIAVDDKILRKPGKYTPEEFEEMKKHAAKGAEIVSQVMDGVEDETFIKIAQNVAHYHHEKWDGQGYPAKLSGIGIPPEARIMALADVFDALVSKRCYKEKMDYEKAFKIIEESLGSHFDPELGKMFLNCRSQLVKFYDSLESEG